MHAYSSLTYRRMCIGYGSRRQDERRRVGSGSLRVVVSTKAAVDRAAKSWPVSLSCAQTCPPMNGPYFVETWKTLLSVSGLYRYRPCHDKRGISVTCNWIENNSFFFSTRSWFIHRCRIRTENNFLVRQIYPDSYPRRIV